MKKAAKQQPRQKLRKSLKTTKVIVEEIMHHDKKCAHANKGFLACVLSWKGIVLILHRRGSATTF